MTTVSKQRRMIYFYIIKIQNCFVKIPTLLRFDIHDLCFRVTSLPLFQTACDHPVCRTHCVLGQPKHATPWSESPPMIGQYQVSRGNETHYPMIRIPSDDRSVSGVPGQQDTLPHDQNPHQWQVSIRCPGVTRHTYPMIRIPSNDRSVSGVPG